MGRVKVGHSSARRKAVKKEGERKESKEKVKKKEGDNGRREGKDDERTDQG